MYKQQIAGVSMVGIRKAVPPDVTLEALAFRVHSCLDEMNPCLPYKKPQSLISFDALTTVFGACLPLYFVSFIRRSRRSILGSGEWGVCMGREGLGSNLSCIVTLFRTCQSVNASSSSFSNVIRFHSQCPSLIYFSNPA